MFFKIKNHFVIILIILSIILNACKLQEPSNNHGIMFLKNRSEKISINKSNKNDVINVFGQPHSTSINNKDEWIYIERVITKGSYHKLGRNVLSKNNVLILSFDKYGVLKEKVFLDKKDSKKIAFSKKVTENELTQRSFIESFLSSVREKMYGNK